jgi:flavin reductase (DIM6/NTAB) family NADH-FMN oxidoreductase RutF
MSSNHLVEAAEFTRACSRFATGIVIASVCDAQGVAHGLTANSLTSVSLTPPLILICIGHSASVLEAFRSAGHFGISVLAEDQRELSDRFARKGHDRFDGTAWQPGHTGVPLVAGGLGTMECSVYQRQVCGDHDIVVGQVLHTSVRDGKPLIYFGSKYRFLA